MTEEKMEVQETSEAKPDFAAYLATFPGAPQMAQIEEWKKIYNDVMLTGLSDLELFIWHPVSRKQFLECQEKAAFSHSPEGQQKGIKPMTEADFEELIVKTCILWGSEFAMKSLDAKGGTLSTLHEQIMFNSNFINPAAAQNLVVKL